MQGIIRAAAAAQAHVDKLPKNSLPIGRKFVHDGINRAMPNGMKKIRPASPRREPTARARGASQGRAESPKKRRLPLACAAGSRAFRLILIPFRAKPIYQAMRTAPWRTLPWPVTSPHPSWSWLCLPGSANRAMPRRKTARRFLVQSTAHRHADRAARQQRPCRPRTGRGGAGKSRCRGAAALA